MLVNVKMTIMVSHSKTLTEMRIKHSARLRWDTREPDHREAFSGVQETV